MAGMPGVSGVAACEVTKLPLGRSITTIIRSAAGASLAVHGATCGWWSSTRGKALSGVGVGVLSRVVPAGLVDEVLAGAGLPAGRQRALPGRLVVLFVLGLCLFSDLPYGEVVRSLASGLSRALAAAGWQVPATTALTRARRRVGEKPLELLFGRLCSALTPAAAPWSHVCGLLAVAWDGTTIKAPATGENRAAFARPGRNGKAAQPKLRLVALIACGTRALAGAAVGPYRTGERALAGELLGCLRAGMLLIADRGFYSWTLWNDAAATGADLLWRVQCSMHLRVTRGLGDGSWLSVIPSPQQVQARCSRNGKRRRRGSRLPPDTRPLPGITVRVIEFTITVTTSDGTRTTEAYRLITTLLDPAAAPAASLTAGYAWRWAIETGFREFKTYLRGPGRVCAAAAPPWPARNYGPTWSSTRPSAPSSAPPPREPASTPTGSPSPPPCAPSAAPCPPPAPAPPPPSPRPRPASHRPRPPARRPHLPARRPRAPLSVPRTPQRPAPSTARHLHRHHQQPSPATPHPRHPAQTSPSPPQPGPLSSWHCAGAYPAGHPRA